MTDLLPDCSAVNRPQQLFNPAATVHGLRAARTTLVAAQRVIEVFLYRAPPAALANAALWTLREPPGATPVAISAAAIAGGHVALTIAGLPDPVRYRLELTPPAGIDFDPLRLRLPVRLRPECPDLGNCFTADAAPATRSPSPVQDYTARDWNSLRTALLEFHLARHPDADTSIADPTVILIELFAHVGDLLHYQLDRAATEAYLSTARLRTSVRRHARLLDYLVADAVAATTDVHLSVTPGAGNVAVAAGTRARPAETLQLSFTIDDPIVAHDSLGEIAIYDWGESQCCLPSGSTSAVLVRPIPADPLGANWLAVGDRVVFEAVDLGNATTHDRWRRRDAGMPWPQVNGVDAFRSPLTSRRAQVVELTEVAPIVDPLAPALALSRVSWASADGLRAAFPVSPDESRGAPEVTVARGNMVRAHHGVLVTGSRDETLKASAPSWAERLPRDERAAAPTGQLLIGAGNLGLARRGDGSPYLLDVEVTLPSGSTVTADYVTTHLGLPSRRLAVTVEEEEWRPPLMRFRTGEQGTDPPDTDAIAVAYEVGGGVVGNIPAYTLSVLERNTALPNQPPAWQPVGGAITARNPVAATGGADPEPLDRVRRGAPQAFAAFAHRAVTPGDHAEAARSLPGIDRASAMREWTGAWPLIRAVVDVLGTDETTELDTATAHLDGLRMIGQEVSVVPGVGVGLVIGLTVCLMAGADPEAARRAILGRLRPGTAAAPGLFHPDRLPLGGPIRLSALVAVAASLPGVDAVQVTTARRLNEPAGTLHDVLTFAPNEIALLDDDPAHPERGRLELTIQGGR